MGNKIDKVVEKYIIVVSNEKTKLSDVIDVPFTLLDDVVDNILINNLDTIVYQANELYKRTKKFINNRIYRT